MQEKTLHHPQVHLLVLPNLIHSGKLFARYKMFVESCRALQNNCGTPSSQKNIYVDFNWNFWYHYFWLIDLKSIYWQKEKGKQTNAQHQNFCLNFLLIVELWIMGQSWIWIVHCSCADFDIMPASKMTLSFAWKWTSNSHFCFLLSLYQNSIKCCAINFPFLTNK